MSTVKSFVIAKGNEERLELKVVTQLKGKELGRGPCLWALAFRECFKPFLEGVS